MVLRLQLRRLDDTGPVDLPEVDCGMEPLVLGRNPASDLVLADPDRLVSSSHARIEPAEDGYRLVDTSVNGILLNEEKLPSNAVVTLAVGDLIQIMRYELRVVALDTNAPSQPSLAAGPPVAADPLALLDAQDVQGALDTGNSTTADFGDLLAQQQPDVPQPLGANADALHQGSDLESLFVAPNAEPDPDLIQPAAASDQGLDWWQDVEAPVEDSGAFDLDMAASDSEPNQAGAEGHEPSWDGPETPSAGAGAADIPVQPSNAPTGAGQEGLGPLLAGLGLPPDTQLDANQLHQLGEVTRIMLEGVIGSVRSRAEVKNQLRMVRTVLQANDNNPLKVAVDTPDALELLFLRPRAGFLDAVTAAQATMADLNAHELAMFAGFRKAMREVRGKIEPASIEGSFDSALLSVVGKHRFWDRYVELYERFCRQDDYLDEQFASAYDEMIRQLESKQ